MTGATALMRTGRKRKSNVKRDTTTGRSRGEIIDLSPMLNQPHRRGFKKPDNAQLGYPLGRLELEGNISKDQMNTGNAFAALVLSFCRMYGIPNGSPKSGAMTQCIASGFYAWEGDAVEIDQEETDKRRRALKSRYDLCHDRLHEVGRTLGHGTELLKAARLVCIEERYPNDWQLGNLRIALNKLQRILRTN